MVIKQHQWEKLMREDLKHINEIEMLGWNRSFNYNDIIAGRINPNNVPHNPVSFKRNNFSLWFANHKWIIAMNKNGRYFNHQYFNKLMDAVNTFKHNPAMFYGADVID